jgi:hypothetical protein
MVEPDRPQMTIWHMRIACWITKATDTHSLQNIYTNMPQYYVIRTLTLFFSFICTNFCISWTLCKSASGFQNKYNICQIQVLDPKFISCLSVNWS